MPDPTRQSHPLYSTWTSMKHRCKPDGHPRWGGRGIRVCDRWANDFMAFVADMGPKPEPAKEYSIDRIDNDGDYEPGNCRWATWAEQVRNRAAPVPDYLREDYVWTPRVVDPDKPHKRRRPRLFGNPRYATRRRTAVAWAFWQESVPSLEQCVALFGSPAYAVAVKDQREMFADGLVDENRDSEAWLRKRYSDSLTHSRHHAEQAEQYRLAWEGSRRGR